MFKIEKRLNEENLSSSDFFDIINQLLTTIKHLNMLDYIRPIDASIILKQKHMIMNSIQTIENHITRGGTMRTVKTEKSNSKKNKQEKFGEGTSQFSPPEITFDYVMSKLKTISNICKKEYLDYETMQKIDIDLSVTENAIEDIECIINQSMIK